MSADVDVSVRWVEVKGVVGHLSCLVKRREVRRGVEGVEGSVNTLGSA